MIGYAPGSSEDYGTIAQGLWAQNILPQIQQAAAKGFGAPAQPVGQPNPTIASNQASLPGALDIGKGINDYYLNYQKTGIPNYAPNEQALSGTISNLLNPADAQANYDVSMHGAEMGVGKGQIGGPNTGETTGRLRQADIERRAALGANLIGQEVSWLPKPYDPSQQLLDPNLMAQLQNRTAIEQARILNELYNRGPQYSQRGGGGYGFDPMAGTTRRTPVSVASGGQFGSGGPGTPQIGGGGPMFNPDPGATLYQNPDGSYGWGVAPPPTNMEDFMPDTGTPDPVLFGTDWQQGTPYWGGGGEEDLYQ